MAPDFSLLGEEYKDLGMSPSKRTMRDIEENSENCANKLRIRETRREYVFEPEERGKIVRAVRAEGFMVRYYCGDPGEVYAGIIDKRAHGSPRIGSLWDCRIEVYYEDGDDPKRLNDFLSGSAV